MGSVYPRGKKLWVAWVDASGRRKARPSGCVLGEEAKAREVLELLERQAAAERAAGDGGPVTVQRFGEKWVAARKTRGIGNADDEASALRYYVWPAIGEMLLKDVRPRHIRDLVRSLRDANSKRYANRKLAPRTVRNTYSVASRLFRDAVVDELIQATPCVLKRGDLPGNVDKDPTWRARAVFTRDEVEQVISDERIPKDRRVAYALLFLAGLRFGESAALRWRSYDQVAEPLGRLDVTTSWNSRRKIEKATKMNRSRSVPVHPVLARVLAGWKLRDWSEDYGRKPEAEDLILPGEIDEHGGRLNRAAPQLLRAFHKDLRIIGLRPRRQHDLRRTFITLARADGAIEGLLHFVTHGPDTEIMDLYTSPPWEALCAEVSKLRVGLRGSGLVRMPRAAAVNAATPLLQSEKVVPQASDSPRFSGVFSTSGNGFLNRGEGRALEQDGQQPPVITNGARRECQASPPLAKTACSSAATDFEWPGGFARALREARVRAELTQAQLASRAGVSQQQIAKLESDGSTPSPTTLRKLARALGLRLLFSFAP